MKKKGLRGTLIIFLAGTAIGGAQPRNISCGNSQTGSNMAPFAQPFGPGVSVKYQQICEAFLFPSTPVAMVKTRIRFTSNPNMGSGPAEMNVTIRMAQAVAFSNDPVANLGDDSQVVFNGPISVLLTGQPGDLSFDLMKGRPFVFLPWKGALVVQIEVWDSNFGGAFLFGDPYVGVWRVFQRLDSTHAWALEPDGLTMTISVRTGG